MSILSSGGRRSVSSGPSATSSHTLASGYSGTDRDNGEGSAVQRSGFAQRRSDTSRGDVLQPHGPASTLSVGATEDRDFARRKERHRKSGGFLLDTSFGSGPSKEKPYVVADKKGKRGSRHSHTQERNHHHPGPQGEHNMTQSSPLSRETHATDRNRAVSGHQTPSPRMQTPVHDNVHIAKNRSTQGVPSATQEKNPEPAPRTAHATIDPNQIVHMALNLSESRRRNLASGQLLIPQPRVSSVTGMDGSVHSQGTGGSLRQYLNDQRRASRNMSPGGRNSTVRHMSTSIQRSGMLLIQGRQPSPALLARRDKALAFFELRIEYLRLLDFLPPLKPDASEPGNFIFTANNVPGSPHVHLTRTPSYANKVYSLGRPYNPLQFLRNRRLRAREKKSLDHLPEEFADVDRVRDWVDRVEKESKSPHYRQTDRVILPSIHDESERQSTPGQYGRPHMVWMFTSEELLADAYWLEHNDNKTMIEDRHGYKIFPPKEPEKQEFLQPRPSKEYPEKRRRSWVEGVTGTADVGTGDESETTSERGRKRRLLPTFRTESPKPKGHNRIISKVHTGHTDSSDSDSDTKWRRRKPHKVVDSNKDTGPLELRMKELLEKEAQETQADTKTPIIFTPDTPDKWGREQVEQNHSGRNSLDVPGRAPDFARPDFDLGLRLPPTNRSRANGGVDPIKKPGSSFDNNTAPNTPLIQKHFPLVDGKALPSLSRPSLSREGSQKSKTKKNKLDVYRSDESSKHHHQDHTHGSEMNGLGKKQNSRLVNEEADEANGIGAAIWAAPGAVKHLLGHRKNDSVSSLRSPSKESRKEPKEPHSAVTRFLKGVKHEGSKVQEFIFRKDRPLGEYDSDSTSDDHVAPDSDSDDDANQMLDGRPSFKRTKTAGTVGSIHTKQSNHYHLELPSFRSSQKNNFEEDEDYSDSQLSDHVTRQARERAISRSSRFDRLAPPRMDLSRISSKDSQRSDQDRVSRVLAHPGGVGRGGLPITALANSDDKRASSRPTLEGKRHWSITDENGNEIHRSTISTIVTAAEIARVRALFLCSGVKAKEIVRHTSEVQNEPPAYLKRAAETANARLYPVPRKEEHVLASRLLLNDFENSTSSLYTSATTFRDSTVKELTSLISTLTAQIESDLFPRVRNSGDEAVTITSDVNSTAPLTVKQVTDEIDRMLRMRRRRMRWVRRVGWTMVEWMLLSFMWFAWLTVTVVGAFGRIFGFFWNLVKWLLWI